MRSFFFSQSATLLLAVILFALHSPCCYAQSEDSESMTTTLVVGATGATGKHVVHQLLQQDGANVKVIVRSKERMLDLLDDISGSYHKDRLTVTEAALLDLTDEQLQEQVRDADAVVSCLGHNMNFQGLYGHPRKLVTDAAKRLTTAMKAETSPSSKQKKFVLMGSDGVANPAGTDDPRPAHERFLLFLLRHLVPPVKDNEGAAQYLYELGQGGPEWVVVRPTDLIDGDVSKYTFHDKPIGSLFGSGVATRANVAKSMVDLLTDDPLWQKYKYQMPEVVDSADAEPSGGGGEL